MKKADLMITSNYKTAVLNNEKLYVGGKCANGNIAARLTASRHCTCEDCVTARKARQLVTKRASYPQRKVKVSESSKNWVAKNKEYDKARKAKWKAENPDRVVAWHARRRATKLKSIPSWSGELDSFAITQAAELCRLRLAATGFAWEIDHMIPLQANEACGLHCAANLQVIPMTLNASKQHRMQFTTPGEWIGRM